MEFYSLWRRAGRSQKVTSDYDAVIVDGGGRSDGNVDAFSDYIKILRTIGRDLAQVAQWVCIQGMSANEWAENNGHDPRGGVTVLRLTMNLGCRGVNFYPDDNIETLYYQRDTKKEDRHSRRRKRLFYHQLKSAYLLSLQFLRLLLAYMDPTQTPVR
jgi:hypothetical protein